MLTLDGVDPPRTPGKLLRVVSFVRPYSFALVSSIALFTIGWITWRGRAIIVDLCRQLGYRYGSHEPELLPEVGPKELIPEGTQITLSSAEAVDGNVSELELVIISQLVSASGPKSIFEIGTFDGRTTLNLAMNAGEGSDVHTLDLPRAATDALTAPLHPHETRYVDKPQSGARYRGTVAENRIRQHYGDSGTFDFSPFYGAVDFIFVDGSHAYSYVVNDSLHAVRMLRDSGGVIVWHDYGRWDGVTRALNDLRSRQSELGALVRVRGTTLAVLRSGRARAEA